MHILNISVDFNYKKSWNIVYYYSKKRFCGSYNLITRLISWMSLYLRSASAFLLGKTGTYTPNKRISYQCHKLFGSFRRERSLVASLISIFIPKRKFITSDGKELARVEKSDPIKMDFLAEKSLKNLAAALKYCWAWFQDGGDRRAGRNGCQRQITER